MNARIKQLEPLALDAAVFLLLALSLSLPSGYSWGAVMLLVLGLFRWPAVLLGRVGWPSDMRAWAVVIVLMGLAWSLHILADGTLITNSLGLDRCLKYLLVFLAVPALLNRRPSEAAVNWGCWVGAISAGLTALWQVSVMDLDRAAGYTNAIQFGNLSLLLAAWSGVRALRAPNRWQKSLGWLAMLLGIVASVTSGSRGGWITLPALLLLGFWFSAPPALPAQSLPRALRAVGLTVLACLALLAVPQVQQRAAIAIAEWVAPEQPHDYTSVGLRRSFWEQALIVGQAHPWLGVGQIGYEELQREAVAKQEMPESALEFNHAHNEWLDMFAKRGLLGVGSLALFFAVPGVLFARRLRHTPEGSANPVSVSASQAHESCVAALCGLMTVLGFLGFGLTQVMFAHNNGNMMYLLTVTLWLACLRPSPSKP